jgi:hypothetical protein
MLLPFQNQRVTTRSLLTQGAKSIGTTSLVTALVVGVSLPVFADDKPNPYGEIQFGKSEYNVNEDDGSVTLKVKRTGGKSGQMTVKYGTTGASAMPHVDYEPTSGMLTWGDGDEEEKSIEVNILSDEEKEDAEMFYVTLLDETGNPGSAKMGKRISAKVKIENSKMMETTPPPPAPTPIGSGVQVMFTSVVLITKTVITRVVTRFRFKSIFRYHRSANGDDQNFLNAFSDSLETVGLGEFYVENGGLLIPAGDYLSWLSANASEPTSIETETGIFVDDTTGLAYLVYDEDGSRLKTDLYPVLAPEVAEGLIGHFPEGTLTQSAEGLTFSLGDAAYDFTTTYVANIKGFDDDPFDWESIPGGLELCNAGWCQEVYFK